MFVSTQALKKFKDYFYIFASDDDEMTDSIKEEDKNDDSKEEKVTSGTAEPESPTLEELANSDFIRNRQLAAKSIVEYLHQAGSNREAQHSVISIMCKLSEDEDIMVRSELMEHIPTIAIFCKEHAEDLDVVIRQQIVPYTVKLLTDFQRQVRKIGHTTLLVLLENNIIDTSQLSEWICPLIAQLATSENIPDELRLEDVSVMCKMIPYIGKEITEKFFLEPFLSMCRDSESTAREVCLLYFGSVSHIVGRETTETTLLSVFLDLCVEDSWKIRLKCVDIAVDLANVVSPTTRNEIITPVYLSFLKNDSHAVWHAASLCLGKFIATFADAAKTGLSYSDGMWIDTPMEDENVEDHLNENYCEYLASNITPESNSSEGYLPSREIINSNLNFNTDSFCNESPSHISFNSNSVHARLFSNKCLFKNNDSKIERWNKNFMNSELSDTRKISNSKEKSGTNSPLSSPLKDRLIGNKQLNLLNNENNNFNNFQYWRTPLPEIELDLEIELNLTLRTKLENRNNIQVLENEEKIYSFENGNNLYLLENEQLHSLENVGGLHSLKIVQPYSLESEENPYSLESEENPHTIESEQSHSLENVENSHSLLNEQSHSLEHEESEPHSLENEENPCASENKPYSVENEVKSHCDTNSGSQTKEHISKDSGKLLQISDVDSNFMENEDEDSLVLHLENLQLEFKKEQPREISKAKTRLRRFIHFDRIQNNQSSTKSECNSCQEIVLENQIVDTEVLEISSNQMEQKQNRSNVYNQDIVPPELLVEFRDIVTTSSDTHIRETIAYYFPSVAYALGREYWPCIKELFYLLASDINYKIRKSIASSLHELAIILGQEITTRDLLPVFLNLLEDYSIRHMSSILVNLSQFLKKLKPHARREFLPLIQGICSWDDERDSDWRYRLTIAEQFVPCIELFNSSDALYQFLPIALLLLQDKVSAVRMAGVELLAVLIRALVSNQKSSEFLCAFDEKYRKANKWLRRQLYVYICQELAVKRSLPTEVYVNEIVPNLFSLAWDPVPNVRLAVARCLGLTLLPLDYFPSIQKAHYQLLLQVMFSLQNDIDRDVRHFAHLSASAFNVLPPKECSSIELTPDSS